MLDLLGGAMTTDRERGREVGARGRIQVRYPDFEGLRGESGWGHEVRVEGEDDQGKGGRRIGTEGA